MYLHTSVILVKKFACKQNVLQLPRCSYVVSGYPDERLMRDGGPQISCKCHKLISQTDFHLWKQLEVRLSQMVSNNWYSTPQGRRGPNEASFYAFARFTLQDLEGERLSHTLVITNHLPLSTV